MKYSNSRTFKNIRGSVRTLTPIYGQNNGIFKTFCFENIREHRVKFENNRGYLNRKDKFENIRGFRGFCADPDVNIAREHFAIIWNYDANNEGLIIIKQGNHLHFSAKMIAPSKRTAKKIRWRPRAMRVVGRSINSQFMLSHS